MASASAASAVCPLPTPGASRRSSRIPPGRMVTTELRGPEDCMAPWEPPRLRRVDAHRTDGATGALSRCWRGRTAAYPCELEVGQRWCWP